MELFAIEVSDDQPAVLAKRQHRSFMIYGVRQPFVAIVLTLPDLLITPKDFPSCPVRPGEAADHLHLVLAIDDDRVMHSRVCESISPISFATVQIGPGIAGDVH